MYSAQQESQNTQKRYRTLAEIQQNGPVSQNTKKARLSVEAADCDAGPSAVPHAEVQELPALQPTAVAASGWEGQQLMFRKEGTAGQIHKVKLENFKNHGHFEIEFGPHVNFITGDNGSGKTSIIEGLQFCLGERVVGNANGLRGKMEDVIKWGQQWAKVTVTLWNKGGDGYRELDGTFDEKGNPLDPRDNDMLQIERSVTAGRSTKSEYTVRNQRGKVVARGTARMQRILDHLNIDAGNPINIMTQNRAIEFFNDSNPSKAMYKFFLDGTKFMSSQTNMKQLEADLVAIKKNMRALGEQEQRNKEELKVVEEKLARLDEVERYRNLSHDMEQSRMWLTLYCQREKLEEMQQALERFPAAEAELVAKVEQATHEAEALTAQEAERRAELTAAEAELSTAGAQCDQLKHKMYGLAQQRGRELQQLEEIRRARAGHEQQLQVLREQDAQDKSADEACHNEFEEKMREMESQRDSMKDAYQVARDEYKSIMDQCEAAKADRQRYANELRSIDDEIQKEGQRLDDLQRHSQNRVVNFGGRGVVELARRVAVSPHFRRRPLGPIGAFLGLKDASWGLPVEAAIGGLLNTWVVGTKQDAELLKRMAKEVGCSRDVSVFWTNMEQARYPVRVSQQPGLICLMEMLTITDESAANVVWNTLVDRGGIEFIFFAERAADASAAMNHPSARGHINRIYDKECVQYEIRGSSRIVTPLDMSRQRARLGADPSTQLHRMEAALQGLHEERKQIASLLAEAEAAEHQLTQRHQRANATQLAAMKGLSQAKAIYETSLSQRPPGYAGVSADELGAELHELQRVLGVLAAQAERLETTLEARDREREIARQQLNEIKVASSSQAQQLRELQEALQGVGSERHRAQRRQGVLLEQLQRCREERQRGQGQRDMLLSGLERMQALLQECSEEEGQAAMQRVREYLYSKARDEISRSRCPAAEVDARAARLANERMRAEDLEKLAKVVERQVETAKNQAGGSLEELMAKKHVLEDKLLTIRREWEPHNILFQKLKRSWKTLRDKEEDIFNTVAELTAKRFEKMMKCKSHIGHLQIDRAAEELRLQVVMNGCLNPHARCPKDLKELSGGEKSFTRQCLTNAVGDSTDCPFRCFDEYDVAMDALARRITTETLLEYALENAHRQFILLSPLDMSSVSDAKAQLEQKKGVKLPAEFMLWKKLKAPRPGQGA